MKITIKQLSLLKLTMTKTKTNRFSGQNRCTSLLVMQIYLEARSHIAKKFATPIQAIPHQDKRWQDA